MVQSICVLSALVKLVLKGPFDDFCYRGICIPSVVMWMFFKILEKFIVHLHELYERFG